MSYNVKDKTITVNGKVFDIEIEDTENGGEIFTVEGFDGLRGEIRYEEYIEEWMNPRSDVDGLLGVMLTSHPRYNLGGGKSDEDAPDDFMIECSHCGGTGEEPGRWELLSRHGYGYETVGTGSEEAMIGEMDLLNDNPDVTTHYVVEPTTCVVCEGECERHVHPAEWARVVHGARVVLPLHFYEHSGITMSAGTFGKRAGYPFDCPWDSGIVGIIFDTAETREECGWENRSDEEIEADLHAEVEVYARYLEGLVSYYNVQDDETGFDEGCGCYIGWNEQSGILDDGIYPSMETAIERRLNEINERAEWAARDTVTA